MFRRPQQLLVLYSLFQSKAALSINQQPMLRLCRSPLLQPPILIIERFLVRASSSIPACAPFFLSTAAEMIVRS